MSRAARDFLVYACTGCGKRIFTDPAHLGRRGRCPLCGRKHVVGGPREAQEGEERRRAPRVKPIHTRVELNREKSKAASKEDVLAQELHALEDLSQTGLAFVLPGRRDTRRLSGVAPPPLAVGDRVQITLHHGGMQRPRVYQAEVARVVPPAYRGKGGFTIGARFVDLTEEQSADLASIVGRLVGEDD